MTLKNCERCAEKGNYSKSVEKSKMLNYLITLIKNYGSNVKLTGKTLIYFFCCFALYQFMSASGDYHKIKNFILNVGNIYPNFSVY